MSKVVGIFTVAGIMVAAMPAGVAAQQANVKKGLSFDVLGDIIYDNNVLRIPDSFNLRPGEKRDDVRYSPALSASYDRDLGRQAVFITLTGGKDFYQNNSYLNRSRFSGGAGVDYRVGVSCSGVVSGNFSSRQNGIRDFSDPSAEDPTSVDDDIGRLQNNRQVVGTYGATANCGRPGGLTFGGSAQHTSLTNKSITRSFADSRDNSFSGFVGLASIGRGQLQVTGSYSTIEYPNRLVGVTPTFAGDDDGLKTYRVGLNYSRPIGTRLTGSIGGSYLTAQPNGGQSSYSSPAYNVALTYTPGVRLTTSLTASRDILASTAAGALYKVVDSVDFIATYKLSNSISTHADLGLDRRNFKQTFATAEEAVPRRTEVAKFISLGAIYAPRRLYDVSFDIRQNFRTSNPSIYNYNSTTVTLSLAVHI
ncbi:MAG: outer membrane beta-barrel protein [Janthinobacterium lividum]